jgi:glutathione synthase/RimK-type ligase-like ATP-grasp enzyme
MRSVSVLRVLSRDLDGTIQRCLSKLRSKEFTLSIYFGRCLAKRYDPLGARLHNLFDAPLLRATFERSKTEWQLRSMRTISTNEILESHRPDVVRLAQEYFAASGSTGPRRRRVARYELAILHDPEEEDPPSDPRALKRFAKAAGELGMRAHFITKSDYARVSEFDALFIRETTRVDHHTYRFASRAERDGVVVIDDPVSILRCTNMVYLAELFERHEIPAPRTRFVHEDNVKTIAADLGLPCILKQPDSAYSKGVVKVETEEELEAAAALFLEESELFLAQEFMPTDFDWRVGLFEGEPLYVCRYHMAPKHWQIINNRAAENSRYGRVDTRAPAECPPRILRAARRAGQVVGRGLYGVDLKSVKNRPYVIEVNDNPTIESGLEDKVAGHGLYLRIMEGMLRRIEERASRGARR